MSDEAGCWYFAGDGTPGVACEQCGEAERLRAALTALTAAAKPFVSYYMDDGGFEGTADPTAEDYETLAAAVAAAAGAVTS